MQQSHTYRIRTSQRTDQKCGKSVPAPHQDKFIFFLPSLRCFNFFATHNRHKHSWTGTAKTITDSYLTMTEDRRPAYNSVLPQLAVSCKIEAECSYQTFVLGDSEVLRNRQLRQHANRYPARHDIPAASHICYF
jgi:hypothetical protein